MGKSKRQRSSSSDSSSSDSSLDLTSKRTQKRLKSLLEKERRRRKRRDSRKSREKSRNHKESGDHSTRGMTPFSDPSESTGHRRDSKDRARSRSPAGSKRPLMMSGNNAHKRCTISGRREATVSLSKSRSPSPSKVVTDDTNQDVIELFAPVSDDLLGILGEIPKEPPKKGDKIHPDLSTRWEKFLREGLDKNSQQMLLSKYPSPENLMVLKPPKINPEVASAMTPVSVKKDGYQASSQAVLGAAIAALGNTMTKVLNEKLLSSEFRNEIIAPLSDCGKLLVNQFRDFTELRRQFILPNLSQMAKPIAEKSTPDEFLFGELFADNLKTAKAIAKSGAELKDNPVKTTGKYQSKASTSEASSSKSKSTLNFKRPSRRYSQGNRQGGQKQSFRTTNNSSKRSNHQDRSRHQY
jgi:hypothetical protein